MSSSSSLYNARMAMVMAALLIATIPLVELMEGRLNPWIMAVTVAGIAASLVAIVMVLRLRSTLGKALTTMHAVSRGDFEARLIGIKEGGVAGELLHSINDLIDRSDAFVREASASMDYVSQGRYYRRIVERSMQGSFLQGAKVINAATSSTDRKLSQFAAVTQQFELTVSQVVELTAAAAVELHATAEGMEQTAANTSTTATTVSAAAEEASANVQTVAAAAEELSCSIGEINRQIIQSTAIAEAAAEQTGRTTALVQGLADSSNKIGEVVGLISGIASQTNLLALNATIEAARAGDAGKGFVVVANEVKLLAAQTAHATNEIASLISAAQTATSGVVKEIQSITTTIGNIGEYTAIIAAAVEEQGAATQEIARNVERASDGTTLVSGNTFLLSNGAKETGYAAGEVLTAADQLSRQSEQLRTVVDDFLHQLRDVL